MWVCLVVVARPSVCLEVVLSLALYVITSSFSQSVSVTFLLSDVLDNALHDVLPAVGLHRVDVLNDLRGQSQPAADHPCPLHPERVQSHLWVKC